MKDPIGLKLERRLIEITFMRMYFKDKKGTTKIRLYAGEIAKILNLHPVSKGLLKAEKHISIEG